MINDLLTRDERIRLEALNQAVLSSGHSLTCKDAIDKAKKFEEYIRGNRKQKVK